MKSNSLLKEQSMETSTVADRVRIMWCMRLHSALRMAFACAIVAGIVLYTPKFIHSHIKYASFSYLTAILIVSDATLGDTFKGIWHTWWATFQVIPLAMVARWIIDPDTGLPVPLAALAAAVASFLVALPSCTHLMTKRIAFGQIVLVCADAVFSSKGLSIGYMHPVHVAAFTGIGASAALLASLLPFPDLASNKVGELCRLYVDNASERINLYMKAFTSTDKLTKRELMTEAKPIAETGSKLIQSILNLQEGLQWERCILRTKSNISHTIDKLQSMELTMRGIEYSMVSSPGLPDHVLAEDQITDVLQDLSIQLQQRIITQSKCVLPRNSKTRPETIQKANDKLSILPLEPNFPINKYEWVYFFFSCINMLQNDHKVPNKPQIQHEQADYCLVQNFKTWVSELTSKSRLEFAFKCSLSLGLALLFGLIFDKENGVWGALTIAISFVTGKQAVFAIANTRAQGTAIGTAYGVICRFLFRYPELRLISLLTWVIFTGILRHSRMYGPTGGVSAAIAALLILGRKAYGVPNEFAIVRLAEVFIGLFCFFVVELSLQPIRAATLANKHLYITLRAFQECVEELKLYQTNPATSNFLEMNDKQRNLKSLVCELEKLVTDAEMEPDFWFLPFHASCYKKLIGSMSNITDMFYFIMYNMERLQGSAKSCDTDRTELEEHMNNELRVLNEILISLVKCAEKENLIKSQGSTQDPKEESFRDVEFGKPQKARSQNVLLEENEETQANSEEDESDKKKLREKTVQCLGAMRFCISALRIEIQETEMCVKEIVRWVNHSRK